jgi:hypothetical protein
MVEALAALSERLGSPGVDKLFIAARNRGIAVTKGQVHALVRRQGERQIFGPPRPSLGKTASEGPDARFQADLIDWKAEPDGVFRNVLCVINVFSRELYARALPDKQAASVAHAMLQILEELPVRPQFISTDGGLEFKGPVDALLEGRGIVHRTKPVGDVNALSVVDRAIQSLKQLVARILARDAGESWRAVLGDAVEAYNHIYHSSVHAAPADVRGSPVATFLNLQDNAGKLGHNQRLLERRRRQLEAAGAFRRPLAVGKFHRSFQARYGEVVPLREIRGSEVLGGDGVSADIKGLLPVDRGSTTVRAKLALGGARLEGKRDKVEGIAVALHTWLDGPGEKSLASAGVHLRNAVDGYDATLRETHLNLAQLIALFPETLELTRNRYYVRRVP